MPLEFWKLPLPKAQIASTVSLRFLEQNLFPNTISQAPWPFVFFYPPPSLHPYTPIALLSTPIPFHSSTPLPPLPHALFHFFQEVKGIGRISFPYLERKEVSSCRLKGKRSSLLSRHLGGPVCFLLRWGSLLSHCMGESALFCRVWIGTLIRCFWKLRELCPCLPGANSLQSSKDWDKGTGAR